MKEEAALTGLKNYAEKFCVIKQIVKSIFASIYLLYSCLPFFFDLSVIVEIHIKKQEIKIFIPGRPYLPGYIAFMRLYVT